MLLSKQESKVKQIVVIDLGSNSFHLIVARKIKGSIQVLFRLKQKVQLAKGLDENQVLSQEAIKKGVICLAHFAERLQDVHFDKIQVVGTYTLRTAVNKQDFLTEAKKVFPYPIDIISGEQEAKLIYLGNSYTQLEKGRKLVVDIGGGSTEIVIGEKFSPLIVTSCNMGCVSFAKRFFEEGVISSEIFYCAVNEAKRQLKDIAFQYKQLGWQSTLGSSGTIKAVSLVLTAMGYQDGFITLARLNNLVQQILSISKIEHLNLLGLDKQRVDVFVPGVAILMAIFQILPIKRMRYSDGALREGLMYNW